ncbi:MAG: sn-glycerol-3-phosphate ABC transporter ATP-binding protein UgpC [Deltaproteobacteria bacterium]|nr:sn-glycerol-3-phosphate ABC transporter ATP-binding protein UgpC [Deltaproteobacteria bacterium]MBW1817785.1 sn-glycerol-3-phosphate ABC transporter ATP-binding protein UgpC [Deltaproteobacteria bacterium]
MADVKLENVCKRFDDVVAVDDFNLTIEDKEFVVLVGPSGCGKTTTLRMIAGLEGITSGSILIGDRVINNLPAKDRNIAMVFQNYALYPHMTVYQNMAFGLEMRKRPKDEVQRRVQEAAEILGIQDLLVRKPKQLSGGQRQRVALGRAIVRKPEVFLFDEPLSNLDAKLRVQTRVELKKLHERLKTTAVYVTHDQIEAMTMGDRLVVMKDGLIQQVGTPLELYNAPANKFVGGFIGSPAMNFFEAELTASGDSLSVQTGSFSIDLPSEKANLIKGYGEKKVIVGIRPEDLSETGDHVPGKTIPATVEVVEPIGSETYVNVSASNLPLVAGLGRTTQVKPHQSIFLEPATDYLHLFDIRDEKALFSNEQG